MIVRWEVTSASDVGRVRTHNEDAVRVDAARGLVLVADGMGGHAAGEVASRLAVDTTHEALAGAADRGVRGEALEAELTAAVAAAGTAITRRAEAEPGCRGMGTTLLACVLDPAGLFRLAHIGDSRGYLLRDGALQQLTRDHTWVQREVDAGRLSAARARRHPLSNVITRALGADSHEPPDLLRGELRPGDLLLLATDGLTGMVDDDDLATLLRDVPSEALPQALVDAANAQGGTDNISAALVRVLSVG